MSRLKLKINLSALDKSKITERTYMQNGSPVVVKEYEMELMELKSPKILKVGPTWELVKTHLVVDATPKGGSQLDNKIIGDGIIIRDANHANKEFPEPMEYPEEEIDLDKIPF